MNAAALLQVQRALDARGISVTMRAIDQQRLTSGEALEVQRWALAPGRLASAPQWLLALLDRGKAAHQSGWCKFCGCVDARACPGGCAWVNHAHTVCSQCTQPRTKRIVP